MLSSSTQFVGQSVLVFPNILTEIWKWRNLDEKNVKVAYTYKLFFGEKKAFF